MNINDVTIIGSGISGISIARMLLDNNLKVEIFEKESNIGGLIKCEFVDENLFHKVGGHVFNSKNQEVLNWFWNNFDKEGEFIAAKRNAKILLKDQFIGYPIENFLYQLDANVVKSILNELLDKIQFGKDDITSINFEDFLINNFGTTLYELYFKPYNNKIWKYDLSVIPLDWLEGKLPMPEIRTILINNILRAKEESMVHATFWYPKFGGSQFIIDRLAEGLLVNLDTLITSIEYVDGYLLLNKIVKSKNIVFTGNIRSLKYIVDIDDVELNDCISKVQNLVSNGTSNVLCETDNTDLSWLYLPEEKYLAHRIIYTGNFSESNNNSSNTRKTCVVEFSGRLSLDIINLELKKLPGNLVPISYNYESDSYVIQKPDTRQIINDLKICLAKYNIYLHGRFAEWEYYNMDVCIEKSMDLSKIFGK